MVRTKTPHRKRRAEAAARRPPRRNSRGLTTLEWLLIVAAVAGLAALAVVLVQNVVDDTAEQISGSNARVTAARVAAAQINEEASDEYDGTGSYASVGADTSMPKSRAKCERLKITYGSAFEDAGITQTKLDNATTGLWVAARVGTAPPRQPCQIPA